MENILFSYILIAVCVLVSVMAFNSESLTSELIFHPQTIKNNHEWYRFISHGFIHGDLGHLAFNMLTFYFFAPFVERVFTVVFKNPISGGVLLAVLFITGIIVASIYSYIKHKNNASYYALGASGGVASVLFASIIFNPTSKIYIMFIPIGIPAYLFGPLYLAYSYYMGKNQSSNIGHDAHLWGSVYGAAFAIIIRTMI